jgi:hypothetical protein
VRSSPFNQRPRYPLSSREHSEALTTPKPRGRDGGYTQVYTLNLIVRLKLALTFLFRRDEDVLILKLAQKFLATRVQTTSIVLSDCRFV